MDRELTVDCATSSNGELFDNLLAVPPLVVELPARVREMCRSGALDASIAAAFGARVLARPLPALRGRVQACRAWGQNHAGVVNWQQGGAFGAEAPGEACAPKGRRPRVRSAAGP